MPIHVRCQIGNTVEPIIVRIRFSLREDIEKKGPNRLWFRWIYKVARSSCKVHKEWSLKYISTLLYLSISWMSSGSSRMFGLDVRRLDGSIVVLQSFSVKDIKKMHGSELLCAPFYNSTRIWLAMICVILAFGFVSPHLILCISTSLYSWIPFFLNNYSWIPCCLLYS